MTNLWKREGPGCGEEGGWVVGGRELSGVNRAAVSEDGKLILESQRWDENLRKDLDAPFRARVMFLFRD